MIVNLTTLTTTLISIYKLKNRVSIGPLDIMRGQCQNLHILCFFGKPHVLCWKVYSAHQPCIHHTHINSEFAMQK
jgi:hypothetical protein